MFLSDLLIIRTRTLIKGTPCLICLRVLKGGLWQHLSLYKQKLLSPIVVKYIRIHVYHEGEVDLGITDWHHEAIPQSHKLWIAPV